MQAEPLILMAFQRFAGADRPPSWLAMLHGLLAGSGLTLLLFAGFAYGMPRTAWIGCGLLVLAALGCTSILQPLTAGPRALG